MDHGPLISSQRTGARASILVLILVLSLFVLVEVAGSPIMYFGNERASVAYSIGIYIPVLALCALAYRRLR